MIRIFIFLIACISATGCKSQPDSYVVITSPKSFSKLLKTTPEPQLIDVRTPEEYASQHLPKAKNIDWNGDNFEREVSKLDKSKPVFVYCKVGGRSNQASNKLLDMGFSQIYDLDGGIMKWNAEGYSKPQAKSAGMSVADYSKLINSKEKVLISFHAVWCGPCKKMAPYILKMHEEMKDSVTISRFDADENPALVADLKIDGLPALFLYEKGKLVWEHKGFVSEEDLKKQLK